jgi:drug/metabolite transporter (DMT)-like permease
VTVALALGSALLYALADLWNVRIARRAHMSTALVWIFAVGLAIALPAALVLDGLPGRDDARPLAAALAGGVLYVAALGAFMYGLRRGSLSVVAPLAALEGAVGALIAIVAGERLGGLVAFALVLAVVGGVLAATAPGRRTAAGAGWALVAAHSFGWALFAFGEAGSLSAVTVVAVSRLASIAVVLPVALLRSGLALPDGVRPFALGSGLLDVTGFLALAAAVALGPVSVASVLVAQFATFAVILGLVVLGERPARHQLVGVATTLVAVTILAGVA